MNTEKGAILASMCANGGQCITSADGEVTGTFVGIIVLDEAVISSITGSNINGLDGKTLKDNLGLPVQFTAIELTYGTVVLVNGET